MFRGRPFRRSLLVPGCLLVALSAAGCLRPTGLRTSAAPEVSPGNLQNAADPSALPLSTSTPTPATQAPIPPPATPLAAALPAAVPATNPPTAGDPALAAAPVQIPLQSSPAPTPMLDEALERVEAVNRERSQVQAAESLPKPIKIPPPAVAETPPSTPSEPPPTVEPPAPLPDLSEIKPAAVPDKPLEKPQPEKPEPEAAAEPKDEPTLKIAELKLCRRVDGFGSFELIEAALKPGSLVLVYCEMAGIGYEARGRTFVSRLGSRLSIRSSKDQYVVWERDLGVAEDVCRKERRDYYVTYRILLPGTLAPGSYVLELAQTDLLTKRTTTANLALSVAE